MRYLLLLVLIFWRQPSRSILANTTWEYRVSKKCVNTLKFINNRNVKSYDCELNYTFTDTYIFKGDTLIITEKDDSHSEDGGKITHIYKYEELVKGNVMIALGYSEFTKGRWIHHQSKQGNAISWYKRSLK